MCLASLYLNSSSWMKSPFPKKVTLLCFQQFTCLCTYIDVRHRKALSKKGVPIKIVERSLLNEAAITGILLTRYQRSTIDYLITQYLHLSSVLIKEHSLSSELLKLVQTPSVMLPASLLGAWKMKCFLLVII
jgi:hypothetical protein